MTLEHTCLLLAMTLLTSLFGCGSAATAAAGAEAHRGGGSETTLAGEPTTARSDASPGVAVVELFTSEGCSSCPPADRVLGEIVADARERDRPVFALAFHVDYWDRLGWKDPYSDAAYSRRQRDYASIIPDNRVYTPQMIVNGRDGFVGSDEDHATRSIERALDTAAPVAVKLTLVPAEAEPGDAPPVTAKYELDDTDRPLLLHLAVVERGLSTQVKRGENGGRTLEHENVVRSFVTVKLDASSKASGTQAVDVPKHLIRSRASVIAYVQDPRTMRVLGADAADLGK